MTNGQRFGAWVFTDQDWGLRLTLLLPPQDRCKGQSCQREGGRCQVCGEPKRGKDGAWETVTPRPCCPRGCVEKIGGTCTVCGDGYYVPLGLVHATDASEHWLRCVQAKPWCTEPILAALQQALKAALRARGVDTTT